MKEKHVLAIITADIHLRQNKPVCRNDDFFKEQEKKLDYILNLQKKHGVPILDAGDVFDKAVSSLFLNCFILEKIKKINNKIITIPGNHDLVNHSLELFKKSNLYLLSLASTNFYVLRNDLINEYYEILPDVVVYGQEYCTKLPKINVLEKHIKYKKILLLHAMIFEKEKNKYIEGHTAKEILNKYKNFDIIITGHNHKTFVVQNNKQILINPGSLMRMSIDQINHKPSIFLLYDDFTIQQQNIPIADNVFDNTYIEIQKLKKENKIKIEKFINNINKKNIKSNKDYITNVENYIIKNKINKNIQNYIWESIK